jgi:hypothetical protein
MMTEDIHVLHVGKHSLTGLTISYGQSPNAYVPAAHNNYLVPDGNF